MRPDLSTTALPVDLLIQAGEQVYGTPWRNRMAKAIGCDQRMMARCATGKHPIPPHFPDILIALLNGKIALNPDSEHNPARRRLITEIRQRQRRVAA